MVESKLPNTFKEFSSRFPELVNCHEKIARAVDATGPLDAKTCALIKIGICAGAGMESALRSHVRRATQAGASECEIEQAILQAMNTCGFPRTVAAWSWAQIQFKRDRDDTDRKPMTDSVQVIVKLFGSQARDACVNEVVLTFDQAPTCDQILKSLGESYPKIKSSLSVSRIALNQAFVPLGTTVSDSDEVALIGLVGGG